MEQSEGIDPYQQSKEPSETRTEWFGKAQAPVDSGSDSHRSPTLSDPTHPFVEPENDYYQSLKDDPSLSDTQPQAPVTPAQTPAVAGKFEGFFNSSDHPVPNQHDPVFSTDGLLEAIENFKDETQPDSDS